MFVRERHRSADRPDSDLGGALCSACGKKTWRSRKAARRAARRAHPGRAGLLDEYPCPAGTPSGDGVGWHYGHLRQAVRAGSAARPH